MELLSNGGCFISGVEAAQVAAHSWLIANGFTIAKQDPGYIEARRGSQIAFRTKGVMFAKPHEFPILLCLKLNAPQQATAAFAQISIYEDFGFGLLVGAMTKYKRVATETGESLIHSIGIKS